jgi:hypothetical protein
MAASIFTKECVMETSPHILVAGYGRQTEGFSPNYSAFLFSPCFRMNRYVIEMFWPAVVTLGGLGWYLWSTGCQTT